MEHVTKELSPAVTTEQSLVKNTGTTQLVKPCISKKQRQFVHQPTSTVAEFILSRDTIQIVLRFLAKIKTFEYKHSAISFKRSINESLYLMCS